MPEKKFLRQFGETIIVNFSLNAMNILQTKCIFSYEVWRSNCGCALSYVCMYMYSLFLSYVHTFLTNYNLNYYVCTFIQRIHTYIAKDQHTLQKRASIHNIFSNYRKIRTSTDGNFQFFRTLLFRTSFVYILFH